MMGFSYIKSGVKSSSSDNEDVNENMEFEHEELHTTQDSPPRQHRVPIPMQGSPVHSQEEVMPSQAITLQSQNESLQKAVAEWTSLVSTLSTIVQSQDKEILKLKQENKRKKAFDNEEIFGGDDAGPSSPFSEKIDEHTADMLMQAQIHLLVKT
ncbi:hypothetical protein L1987_52958 [Smallanthus sonchifolius]|uniref:Uncharacterized protein n=1 Tax=Smallanthus sonchifolius TaxID=185202 RepID=A0ACB9EVC8_9ASTR|nr:hypothetical protein L1987_52958 [Smallanthus sonchifolius]